MVSSGTFDTYGDQNAGTRLREFVAGITNNNFYIGISADTATGYLEPAKVSICIKVYILGDKSLEY